MCRSIHSLPGVVYRSFNKKRKGMAVWAVQGEMEVLQAPRRRTLAEVCDEFLLLNAADTSGQLARRNASERGWSQGHMLFFTLSSGYAFSDPIPGGAST
jgi:hypothetical protein